MASFWNLYGYTAYQSFIPVDFMDQVWSEDNRDAYFPRPMAKASSGKNLQHVNSRYIQNLRYLRFKNLTVGYTIPANITKKAHIDRVRVYFTGENLCYWSPLKKHTKYLDPEAAFNRNDKASDDSNGAFYPWPKTYMIGLDIAF